MSNDKNPEVVGCDASIMKNVWEIREREYEQKLQLEQERAGKSALASINQDWANRLAARQGTYKRVERKTKIAEDQTDNIWKSKLPSVPPSPPCGTGSSPLGRPGGQHRGLSTPAPNLKDKKGQDKNFKRLQLLMHIKQTQPSAMVWGKSWKYNKSLPLSAENAEATSIWGQCWMFATQQPYSEPGKPWKNGPNLEDPHRHLLWKRLDYRVVESQELDFSPSAEEWQISWKKMIKNDKEDAFLINGENDPMSRYFALVVLTQLRNEALCTSEWNESWRSTKPARLQGDCTDPIDGLINESIAKEQDNDREISLKWGDCWKLMNHVGCNKSKLPQIKNSHNPDWANSWRAAMAVFNNSKKSDPSPRQIQRDTYDNCSKQRALDDKVMPMSHEKKHTELYLHIYNEIKALSQWDKSWQVAKNNSKPCEVLQKVLETLPPKIQSTPEAKEVEKKGHYSASEKADSCYEQLKHNVIYSHRREFAQSKRLNLKHLENILSGSEWKESWKTLKHRMKAERRRMMPGPLRTFGASEEGGHGTLTASGWKDSWKSTRQHLHQEPESWQQGWSITPQIRVDRARNQNHFAPVELPKNGPTGERSWAESWRFQRRSESGPGVAHTSQARSNVASHHPSNSRVQRRHPRSVYDWQEAWMISETEFHHDRPSFTQWREAWRWSTFHTQHLTEQVPRKNDLAMLMEIQPQSERISLQRAKAKMSQSFDNQVFKARYPEKEWNTAWKAGSVLNHHPRSCVSSWIPEKSINGTTLQNHTTENGHGSKWGRSFRLANPMPQIEQSWVESSPNPIHYTVIWSKGKNINNNVNTNFANNSVAFRLWGNSHRFLQGDSARIQNKSSCKKHVDPKVIMTSKTKVRMHLYSNIEKEKKSERMWAGCHLFGKSQPRPKRASASVKNLLEDKTADKFFEEWAESWRVSVRPGGLKKMSVKSLLGWDESWKFLFPPYPKMSSQKAK